MHVAPDVFVLVRLPFYKFREFQRQLLTHRLQWINEDEEVRKKAISFNFDIDL